MKKRLFSIISLIACLCLVFSMSFNCVKAEETEASSDDQSATASGYTLDTFSFYTDPWIEEWFKGDFQGIKDFDSQYEMQGITVEYAFDEDSLKKLVEKAGEFKEYDSEKQGITEEGSLITISKTAKGSKKDVKFVFSYDMETGKISWGSDVEMSMNEIMGKAGLNTLMGMGTVFVVLIFISFIISLFTIFRGIGSERKSKSNVAADMVASPVVATPVSAGTEALAEDEIAAVISAAIAAYEADNEYVDVPADGLVVRSIRKRGFAN